LPAHRKELAISGSNLWYLVGLIASDGCLSSDGRHIDITSKDNLFLQRIKDATGITNRICEKYNAQKQKSFHLQVGNKNLYDFLLLVGLTPHKSLTLGALKVPDCFYIDFLRGVIDGDGCIRHWRHPSNGREQWSLRIYSGSEYFVQWLTKVNVRLLKIKGRIHKNVSNLWVLKYGKMAAKEIAVRCYYKGCLGLERKIKLAQACRDSRQGWHKSKTVLN
jgi:hypothetical protein